MDRGREPADELDSEQLEDADTGRLVARFQAGDSEAFATIYTRYFGRIYGYLRVVLRDRDEAEDLTQQVFAQILEALPRYEPRGQAFGAWLFTIVRNHAISELRASGRVELVDPAELDSRREAAADPADPAGLEAELPALSWVTDPDLLVLIERLPPVQRQVLGLRYMLGLAPREIAQAIDSTPNHVSVLQYRALEFLRKRLTALGRDPAGKGRARVQRPLRQAGVLRNRRYALSP